MPFRNHLTSLLKLFMSSISDLVTSVFSIDLREILAIIKIIFLIFTKFVFGQNIGGELFVLWEALIFPGAPLGIQFGAWLPSMQRKTPNTFVTSWWDVWTLDLLCGRVQSEYWCEIFLTTNMPLHTDGNAGF